MQNTAQTLVCMYMMDESLHPTDFFYVKNVVNLTGRFLGEVDGVLMEKLKEMGIYKQVTVIDYQAMCLHLFSRSGFGMIFQNVRFLYIFPVPKSSHLQS